MPWPADVDLSAFDRAEGRPALLPAGRYVCRVESGELTMTRTGKLAYRLRFTVIEPSEYAGHSLFRWLLLDSPAYCSARRCSLARPAARCPKLDCDDGLGIWFSGAKGFHDPKTLGYRLRAFRRRNVGGLMLDKVGSRTGAGFAGRFTPLAHFRHRGKPSALSPQTTPDPDWGDGAIRGDDSPQEENPRQEQSKWPSGNIAWFVAVPLVLGVGGFTWLTGSTALTAYRTTGSWLDASTWRAYWDGLRLGSQANVNGLATAGRSLLTLGVWNEPWEVWAVDQVDRPVY